MIVKELRNEIDSHQLQAGDTVNIIVNIVRDGGIVSTILMHDEEVDAAPEGHHMELRNVSFCIGEVTDAE